MKSKILVLFLIGLATSCSIIKHYPLEDQYNQAWKGRTYAEIVREFGAPDRVEYDGRDGSILVYEEFITTSKTEVNTYHGRFDPESKTTVKTDKKYIQFFVGPDNVCYLVKSNMMKVDPKSQTAATLTLSIGSGLIAILGILLLAL